MRLQNKGVIVCTAGFRVHPEREDVMDTMLLKCKREVQAALNVTRLIYSLLDPAVKTTESIVATCVTVT